MSTDMTTLPQAAGEVRVEPTGSPGVLRHLNRIRVLRMIREASRVSRVELATQTGLSKPTVNKIVGDLLAEGLLVELPTDGSGRRHRAGPRPKLVAFRPDFAHVIGVDIGANKLLILLADLSGRVILRHRSSSHLPLEAADVLEEVRRAIDRLIDVAAIPRASVAVVSVGTPGVVDPVTLRVSLAPQISGWDEVDIASSIRERLPCRVLVDTEVQLSVLAERWLGVGRGVDDFAYVNIGIGIGAGILMGGERYRGATGAAGEIGYLPIDGDGVGPDARLGFGTFELAAGGLAYARLGSAAARGPRGAALLRLAGGDPDAVDAEVVFAASNAGDEAATEIVDMLVARLASGIASMAAVVDPALIAIGGGLSRAGEPLRSRVEAGVVRLLPRAPRVVLSELGEEAVALGGVAAAMMEWESGIHEAPSVPGWLPARAG